MSHLVAVSQVKPHSIGVKMIELAEEIILTITLPIWSNGQRKGQEISIRKLDANIEERMSRLWMIIA